MKADNAWRGGGPIGPLKPGKRALTCRRCCTTNTGACGVIPIALSIRGSSGSTAISGGESLAVDHQKRGAAPSGWGRGIAGTGASRARRGVTGIREIESHAIVSERRLETQKAPWESRGVAAGVVRLAFPGPAYDHR